MTNREWVNTLSDDSLVEVMLTCQSCIHKFGESGCTGKSCRDGKVEWLKQNYNEQENDK